MSLFGAEQQIPRGLKAARDDKSREALDATLKRRSTCKGSSQAKRSFDFGGGSRRLRSG